MSTHKLPTAIFGPPVPGGPKPTGFIYGNDNIDMTATNDHHTADHDPKPDSRDDKSKEKTSTVKLLTSTFLPLIVSIVLLIRFFRPSTPEFTLNDATIHAFNFSMQYSLLSSQFQVTISSRNRNNRFGIAYENLHVHADYKSEQITFSTLLPAAFLGHNISDVWSPFLSGLDVPVAPYFGEELEKDENGGFLFLTVMIEGKVKYKLWYFSFARHLSVNCPAYLSFARTVLPAAGEVVRFQQTSVCHVDA